jgi:hypothetical protein
VRIPGRFGASVLERIVPRVAKRQGNTFAMIALKPAVPGELWPWLRYEDGAVHYRGPS